jgi:hypothetical protein
MDWASGNSLQESFHTNKRQVPCHSETMGPQRNKSECAAAGWGMHPRKPVLMSAEGRADHSITNLFSFARTEKKFFLLCTRTPRRQEVKLPIRRYRLCATITWCQQNALWAADATTNLSCGMSSQVAPTSRPPLTSV